ncbi:hypothetical protein ABXJ76_03815 [Methylobacter sp. G7]|uniref:hypothetical protein n=1 Tax=Methylobacter sp. G7 TaxID=3230117 RepID=UPI003D80349F
MARLTQKNWQAVRDVWEFDSDQPSMTVASERAGAKFGFKPPPKGTLSLHMGNDAKAGVPWVRRGTMTGIVSAAHRKADHLVNSDDEPTKMNEKLNAISAKKEQAGRDESEDLRAAVIARHRREWNIVLLLRQEALVDRKVDHKKSFEMSKLAKINAELTKIQQDGERRAWGLDDIAVDVTKLSDAQLQDLIAGKMPH